MKLNDIIDLEYLVRKDDDLDSEARVQACIDRDRQIYSDIDGETLDREGLVAGWLDRRRAQEEEAVLPGTVFGILYRLTGYIMAAAGLFSGVCLTASFLAYHGNRPVNVTLFAAVFILLPLIFTAIAAFAGIRRRMGKIFENGDSFSFSIGSALVSSLLFKGLPKLLRRLDWGMISRGQDAAHLSAMMVKMRAQTFKGLFYWPFFILTCLFSVGFSAGALGTTFFRIMVSDMAFGWQSTLLTSSITVYDLVSRAAWPWALLMPEHLAFPNLTQIEGSRIILKDGISVLTTQNLTSWWPFLCMGILFYALIPRLLLAAGAVAARNRTLSQFDYHSSLFNDLIARMQSPVMTVDVVETPVSRASAENPIKHQGQAIDPDKTQGAPGQSVAILICDQVYSETAEKQVYRKIKEKMFCRIQKTVHICMDFKKDLHTLAAADIRAADQVILVHEVWQPPIRGILHYLTQLSQSLPGSAGLQVFLTNDAGLDDLGVAKDSMDLEIWKKAVRALGNPNIRVKRCDKDDT